MTAKKTEAAEKPKGLDLAEFDLQAEAERGATMPVLNPRTGQPLGCTLQVLGEDARAYRSNLRRLRDAAAAAMEREPTDEDDALLLGRARAAAAAITGSGGEPITVKGEAVDFSSVDNAVGALVAYPWLADQVLTFIRNRGNFGKA